MPRALLRTLTAVLAAVLTMASAACGSGAPSAEPTFRTISPEPRATASAIPSSSPSRSPVTPASAGTAPPSRRPPPGTGLNGRTVVLNCPADRADPPCPGTPVPARVVVLDQTGRTTLATIDTDADGSFTVALPAGDYLIRASRTSGTTAKRPTTRSVTVSAGRFTTVTIRLIKGLQ